MAVLDEIEARIGQAIDAAEKAAEDYKLGEKAEAAKEKAVEMAEKYQLGEKAEAAKEKAVEMAEEYKLGEKAEAAKAKAAELAEKYQLSEKAVAAKEKAMELAEKYQLKEKAVVAKDKAAVYAGRAYESVERSFNVPDESRDTFMLHGALAEEGYDWWWHSFTGVNANTGERKSFFIEFFTINPALADEEVVFGQLPENQEKGIKPSYMMVKAGAWGQDAAQIHRFFPWNQVNIAEGSSIIITADNCFLSETRTLGKVEVSPEDAAAHPEWMSQAGEMIWDLEIDKKIAFNVGLGAGKAMRELEAFQMFWHAQGMKTQYKGRVVWNGQVYNVYPETSYGYADKNWGRDFTSPWLWLSSNNMVSNVTGQTLANSAFDMGGGRPKVGNLTIDGALLTAMYYEGTPYEFNFSKVWTLTRTKYKVKEKEDRLIWKVIQETPMSKMYTEVTCYKKDMLKINYEAPDGSKRHNNLWNGGNGTGRIRLYKKTLQNKNWDWELVDDIAISNVGCEYGEYDQD